MKDIPEIIEIGRETNLSIWTAKDYSEEFSRTDAICLTLVDHLDSVAGFLHGRLGVDASSGRSIFELHNIGIHERLWHKGFGSALLKYLIDECRKRSAEKIILNVRVSNDQAIVFYEKYGFSPVSRVKALYSAPPEDGFLMSRPL